MEVTLNVNATEAPGLSNARYLAVKKVLRALKQKKEKITVDVTKSPVDLGLYNNVVSWFPEEEKANIIYVSTQVAGNTVDVSKALDLKKTETITYYVLLK